MSGEQANDRQVFEITGTDREHFLQGLVTNDVARAADGLVYAALLTPQGKYLGDFFLHARDDAILLDVSGAIADSVVQRLTMYKLRADVAIAPSPLHVVRGLGTPPADGFADPRHAELGWRAYRSKPGAAPSIDWEARRVAHQIPETGVELVPGESYILEMGFERLNGVDFRKGCYVGQEVTARMKHKTTLRKGLAQVEIAGSVPVGTAITRDGKPVGTLYTQAGDRALAYLRLDRADGPMDAADTEIRLAS